MTSSMKSGWSFHSNQVSRFSDDRQQTAVRSLPCWSIPVGSVISLHRLVVLTSSPASLWCSGSRVVHMVGEDQVRLAGLDPRGQDADPERAGADILRTIAPSFGDVKRPLLVRLDRAHEGVRDQQPVVQVQRLAVRVAAGRAADLDELLDLGMRDRQVDRRRAPPQRALRDRQRQAVHHPDERHHAGGLAVLARPSRRSSADCPNRSRCRRPSTPARHSRSTARRCRRGCRTASLRKQEIGRPRLVPPLDSTGVAGMNHILLM